MHGGSGVIATRYAWPMATRTPPAATRRSPAKNAAPTKAASKAKTLPANAAKPAAKRPAATSKAAKPAASVTPRAGTPAKAPPPAAKQPSAAQRETRFNILLHTACLKAGTAAAFASISAKVPVLAKLAPVLLGGYSDTVTLPSIQKQLVRDVLDLYALSLSDAEQRGVILLATGAELGADMLSGQLAEQILAQAGSGYLRLVATRMLPLTSIATDIAAAIATTYTVGKRAQVLCNLPGSGARNLGELLRELTAIDQRRLFAWSAEALRLALRPFRGVLWQLRPGA